MDVYVWKTFYDDWRISAANGGRSAEEIAADTQEIMNAGLSRPYETSEDAVAALAALNVVPSAITPPDP